MDVMFLAAFCLGQHVVLVVIKLAERREWKEGRREKIFQTEGKEKVLFIFAQLMRVHAGFWVGLGRVTRLALKLIVGRESNHEQSSVFPNNTFSPPKKYIYGCVP